MAHSQIKHIKKYKLAILGIDPSYTRTGISVGFDGKLVKVHSISFKGLQTKSQKRNELRRVINRLLPQMQLRASQTLVIVERIRTFSSFGKQRKGFGKKQAQGLNPTFIKNASKMMGTIVDTAEDHGVLTYSVDTRSWKAQIVGNSKSRKVKGKRDAKMETVQFVQRMYGINLYVRTNRNGVDLYDDDAADSACICLYGYLPKQRRHLKKEE